MQNRRLGPGTVKGPVRGSAEAVLRSSIPPEATERRPSRTRAVFQAVPASVRHAEVCASVEKECQPAGSGTAQHTLFRLGTASAGGFDPRQGFELFNPGAGYRTTGALVWSGVQCMTAWAGKAMADPPASMPA